MTMQDLAGLTDRQREALEQLLPLDEGERLDARDKARRRVIRKIGQEPQREQFQRAAQGRFPRWLTMGVALMLFIVFFAAANVSIFRVFTAGRDAFLQTIDIQWQAAIVGASTFALAEFMVIASTVAMRVYFQGRDRWLMAVPIVLGLLIAFLGNWAISQPVVTLTAAGLFSVLEALTPPAAVLFMAVIGERLILAALETRQANEHAFQAAHAEWLRATAEPEKHPAWLITYGNAIREAIRAKNASGRGKTEREQLMQSLTAQEWSAIAWREFAAEDWLQEAPQNSFTQAGQQLPAVHPVQTIKAPAPQLVSTNGNGRH